MTNKTQRITSYMSASGFIIYETEQYHKASKQWHIVGDCSVSKGLVQLMIDQHNRKLGK